MKIYPASPSYPISEQAVELIRGHQEVLDYLGHWPSFHDMEVIRLSFDRLERHPSIYNDLTATFYIYDLSKAPSDPDRKQGLLDVLFAGLSDLKMSGWSIQNPILGLSLQLVSDDQCSGSQFRVTWGGCGHDVEFLCDSISVVRLRTLNPFCWSRSEW